MLPSSCHTEKARISNAFLARFSLQKCSPFSNQLKDTQTHACRHTCTLQTPKFLNQKSDNIGHPNGEVGRQRVPIIELVFRATGERRSGQKSQWRATLELSVAEFKVSLCPQILPLAYQQNKKLLNQRKDVCSSSCGLETYNQHK